VEISDKRIQNIKQQVDRAKKSGPGRPSFPNSLKQEVVSILKSGINPDLLSQLTGLSASSLSRWSRGQNSGFHQVSKTESKVQKNISYKLQLPSGISIESSSEELLKLVLSGRF
jgi:hypothetical protein